MGITWRAPGRVNVIGEHTDYNDGFVLPIALPQGIEAEVTGHGDRLVRVTSTAHAGSVTFRLDDLAPGSVDGWAGYVAGVFWAMRQQGHDVSGSDVRIDGDLPSGAGLSSSAALTCAVASAVSDAWEHGLAGRDRVLIARAAENDFVGVPTGSMDQNASVFCEPGRALLLDTRSGEQRQLPFDLVSAGLALLVIDTRSPHRLVDGEYARRRRECEDAARMLGVRALRDVDDLDAALAALSDERLRSRVRHVVTENRRVLQTAAILESGAGLAAIGPLLTASHVSLRDDYEVSSRELDLAVEAALDAGAHGARMTGGGFGGSAIALVDDGRVPAVEAAVRGAFDRAGLTAPVIFRAVASRGAHRIGQESKSIVTVSDTGSDWQVST